MLWKRAPPADASEFTAARAVPDYYKGHHEDDYINKASDPTQPGYDAENHSNNSILKSHPKRALLIILKTSYRRPLKNYKIISWPI